ncbi:actin and actin related protein [Lithospermum erythrorhizon]|uniref:Actin and actin related protein n=1 Tax=Lithospermum erythrorhizon TaxID=34254 RepID=A0AAV3PJ42_LITER
MSTIIRKLWENISLNRSNSTSTGSNEDKIILTMTSASTGEFDKLPFDIFMQILMMIGPKESGRLCGVCKTWRFMIGGDNKLWIYFLQNHQLDPPDFFAELRLRSGPPLMAIPNMMTELSFMQIYGQRTQVPGAIIIDGGSGYCKYGWSKYASPSGQSATFLEFGNIESPMYSRHRHFFTTIYDRMQVKTFTQPIVLSIPICHHDDTESDRAARRQLKDAIYSALFDLNVPAVCAINQATLALFAARRTSGIVVNIGFHHTSIVPILHGKLMHMVGVEVVGIGALKVTGFLKDQMAKKNIPFQSLYTVRTLKENLCYVALDYEAELSKNTEASFEVAPEGWFTLSKERFQTGEILFQPSLAGLRAMGLHQAVALCIDHCRDAELTEEDSWYKTVVLAGGTACLPGLSERLEKELHGCFPPHLSSGIRVRPPPYGAHSAWFGAKLLSTFPSSWCTTKKQFRPKSRRKLLW